MQARKNRLRKGMKGVIYEGKRAENAGGVNAVRCIDNGSGDSERKNTDRAEIRDGAQRAPQAPGPP